MTHEQANRGTNAVLARRRLTEEEVRRRLTKCYKDEYGIDYDARHDVDDCIRAVQISEVWTDSTICAAVVYNSFTDLYIIIATGKHYDLIK